MVTTISGKHMAVGDALQQHVHDRLDAGVKSLLNDITQARVVFSKHTYLYHVEIIIHDSHMGLIKAESDSDDVYATFDTAVVKIEKQLRKYKGKIKRHVKSIKDSNVEAELFAATKYVLDMPKDHHENENHEHEPVTIAEKVTNIETLTVSEAIMKMDLAHLPALLFINKPTQRMNLVYHRLDGNISWVDPGQK